MSKPRIATELDAYGLTKLIQISTVLVFANIIQGRDPSLSLIQCKTQALAQYETALAEDW